MTNIGVGEIIVIVINMALIIGIPLTIILFGFLLFRRIHTLESRIEKLEAKQDMSSNKTP